MIRSASSETISHHCRHQKNSRHDGLAQRQKPGDGTLQPQHATKLATSERLPRTTTTIETWFSDRPVVFFKAKNLTIPEPCPYP
jgi:hypothetical protein